jgi:tetratricopeptide (TPR) repeat protein
MSEGLAETPGESVRSRTTRPFVGRVRELAELRDGLADALSSRSRFFAIVGEPGIGKTRILEELAAEARGQGARVLSGSCHEGDGAPGYWPWIQILRAHAGSAHEVAAGSDPRFARIAESMPVASDRRLARSERIELESDRFRLFDDVTCLLEEAARSGPLVLAIDDMHWADRPSLLLLRFVVGRLRDARILGVVTHRPAEPGAAQPLAEVLRDAARVDRIRLEGLREQDVGRFMEVSLGSPAASHLKGAVHGLTGGNPFYVSEVVRLLAAEPSFEAIEDDAPRTASNAAPGATPASSLPRSVREVLGRRLDRLGPDAKRMLTMASALGIEFDLAVVQSAAGLERERLMAVIGEALAAGLLRAVSGAVGRYAFFHALVRRSLYEDLTPLARIELHRRLAAILEVLPGTRPDRLAELAHHFLQAAEGGDVDKAVEYASRAAAEALEGTAYEEAARHYEQALDALRLGETDEPRRAELLIGRGDAELRAGETAKARTTLLEAAALARRLGRGDLLARAALSFGWWVEPGRRDDRLVALLEEAASGLGDADSALRSRLLAHLAAMIWYADVRQARVSREAVEIARRIGDDRALAYALSVRHLTLWGPENVAERLAVADEVVRLASDQNDTEGVLQGRVWLVIDRLELGDIQQVDVGIAACARLAESLRQPVYLWWTAVFRGMRALLDGRFEAAENLIPEALGIGQRVQSENALQVYATQMFLLRREQGRLAELEGAHRGMVEQYPDIPAWRAGLAMLYRETDRRDEARRELDRLAAHDFRDLPRDLFWLIGIALSSDVASWLGDERRAALLYDLLLPYADRTIVTGRAVVCAGSASQYLGALAATMGRCDEAEAHFERALAMNARLGTHPFTTYAEHDYARMLLRRDHTDDRRRARVLLERAAHTSQRLGMTFLHRKVAALRAELEAGDPRSSAESGASVPRDAEAAAPDGTRAPVEIPSCGVFRIDGASWMIEFGGAIFRMRDTSGMRFLAELLRQPGRELHALDLVASWLPPPHANAEGRGGAEPTADSARARSDHGAESLGPGDAGEVLDRTARLAYKRRIDELAERLAQAKQSGAIGEAARLEDERERLVHELSRAAGFGSGERRAGSTAERARLNVTRAIKSAERAIDALCPALAAHLRATIRTGTFCAYRPDPRTPVAWSF